MFWPYYFIDPLWIIVSLPALLLMLYAQFKVRGAYSKYSQVPNMQGMSGAQAARRLLDAAGLTYVPIEVTPGELSDHYDPRAKVLRLSPSVYRSASVAALGITAHEVGHALQDKVGYVPLRVRSGLVPVANIGSWLGYIFVILGFIAQASGLIWLGIALFSGAVVFALITLPVEYNASGRALQLLRTNGMVSTAELQGTQAVLNAAALTYVAALLQAIGQLLYWVLLAVGMGRRQD
ncbi:MAG: zinc metallopeptidase [Chloroflexi bacterium]|nr:zinc metallopeptidase [Chloroflexota bacterium]